MNKPKYQIGDKVWVIDKINHLVEEREIKGVAFGSVTLIKEDWLYYLGGGMIDNCNRWYSDSKFFPTKQDLINSL